MATYSLEKLSGSTDGRPIKVTGTATAGAVTLHTATAGSGDIDMVELWAQNNDADGETRTLTVEWGGVTAPDDQIIVSVPCKAGPISVTPTGGMPIMNSLLVKAFADEANDVVITGVVRRVDK